MCDELGILIWYANWWRSVDGDDEVERILSESVVCGVVNVDGLAVDDENEGVGIVVHESEDWM